MQAILPTTPAQTISSTTLRHLQGTFQFATLITMPSPRTSKLYNTSMNTPCNLSYPAHSPITADGTCRHNSGVVEVSKLQVSGTLLPFPEEPSTFHIGVCTKSLMLDRCLVPSRPPSPPSAETETARAMIVQAPPHRFHNEESEEEWNRAWMWRGF